MPGELKTVYQALAEAKAAMSAVGKDSRNQQQGWNFRGVDAVVNACAPQFNKAGVIVVPALREMLYGTVEVGKLRTPMAHVQVKVKYTFYGPDGSSVSAVVPGEAMDSGDKAVAKAMSVAYRICLLQVLNLPTSDPDPDEDTYERSGHAQRPHDEGAGEYDVPQEPPAAQRRASGQQRRPQGRQDAPAIDAAAQAFAQEALAATTVLALKEIHDRAHLSGKLSEPVRNPISGGIGGLGKFITWRKSVIEDEGKALEELTAAAKEAGEEGNLADWILKVAGTDVAQANAAQLRATAAALRTHR